MARTYSEQLLNNVYKSDDTEEGVRLAKACIDAKLPAQYVANALGVSRMTIHSWFRGSPIRNKNNKRVKVMLQFIDLGLLEGVLPAKTMSQAKEFTDSVGSALNSEQ